MQAPNVFCQCDDDDTDSMYALENHLSEKWELTGEMVPLAKRMGIIK